MSTQNPCCPECQTELEDDFGIVDCKSCGAVCSLDLEGNVQIQGEIAAPVEVDDYEEPAVEEIAIEEPLEETALEEEETDSYEELSADASAEVEEYQTEEAVAAETEEPPLEEDNFLEETPAVLESDPMGGADFLKDLEFFTEESTAEELEHTYYDLSITGIGSNEERVVLVETLADSRLEISEEFLNELIGDESSFVLPQISFLRLSVIYKRLSSLNIKMSWGLSEEQQPRLQEESGEYSEEDYSEETEYTEDDLS